MARITRRSFVSGTVAAGVTAGVAAALPRWLPVRAGAPGAQRTRFYVIDNCRDPRRNRILIYDADTGQRVGRLPARSHADLAVSPDGGLVYICDSVILRDPPNHPSSKVKVYDAKTLTRLQRFRAPSRAIYSVAPFISLMSVSNDGRYLYLVKRRRSRSGKVRYRMRIYDVQNQAYSRDRVALPEMPMFMSSVRRRPDLMVGFQGKRLEGIGKVNPQTDRRVTNLHKLESSWQRGPQYMVVGIAIDQAGKRAYSVTRNGRVCAYDITANRLAEERQLEIPSSSAIPLNQVLVWGNHLIVGVSSANEASIGNTESVYVFDGPTFNLVNAYSLDPPAQELALAPDGSALYAASFSPTNCISKYSKGRRVGCLQTGAHAMNRFVVAYGPSA
jgi:DNA-binding beta-propeller fold protein YncE